ncbi:MAG: RNA-directed DNA polymerase [Plesiomonas shigelloides]
MEEAISRDVREGWQLLSRWYKRTEDRGLAISHESLKSVEQEFGSLYTASESVGEMLPVDLVTGKFVVPDHIPDEEEIRVALGRLKRHKAPGPSGLSVDVLKEWEAEGGEMWRKLVDLVQWCIATGETPQAFKYGALVLIPKAERGKYRGIALLESVYKLISGLINHRVTTAVKFHDAIHGFRGGRSCSTAILEAKLEMQRARQAGKVYYQVFLDLSKAYDTVDRTRLRQVLQAYGLGPRVLRFLDNSWDGSGVVPRKLGRYGRNVIRTDRGVKQGDIPSPTFFNLVVDLVIRAEEAARLESGGGDVRVVFYADDGRLGGEDPLLVQASLTRFVDLFARMGLQMNAVKTEAMVSSPVVKEIRIREGAYQRKMRGSGPEYVERSSAVMQCPIAGCGKAIQKRSMARHIRNQHPGERPPRLELEDIVSPVRPIRQAYSVDKFQGKSSCPVAGCVYECATSTQMRRHFLYRHPDDQIHVIGEEGQYVKCPDCGQMVREPISAKHRQSKLCRAGLLRSTARKQQQENEAARSVPHIMRIGAQPIKVVGEFRYLGRVISHDDSDLPACVRNIQRARQKWGELSKLLRKEAASTALSARFYLVVVSAILLYGSETWVISKRIEDLLNSFHNRCARTIGKTFIRKTGDDEWVYPSVEEALKRAHLRPLSYYLHKRRLNFKNYAERQKLYKEGDGQPDLVQPFPTLWTQYNQLNTESDLEFTPDCERNLDQDLAVVQN